MKIKLLLIVVSIVVNYCPLIIGQPLVINELMSSNGITISDEDGDYSDWIELYNNQTESIDLTGYGLSDDPTKPFKWMIPSVSLEADNHLLIFASDKNRTDFVKHWETVINWGDTCKYLLGNSEPSSQWKDFSFDDQSWELGPSGFGFGDEDDATIVPFVSSVYIRKTFSVEDVNNLSAAVLHVDYDDAFVAYLNGTEIARANIGTVNIPPVYDESSSTDMESLIIYGGKPKTHTIQNFQSLLQNGENLLSIQVHNFESDTSDLTLIPFLTLGMKTVPATAKGVNLLLDLPIEYLHTNFKLNSDSEVVIVTNPQGSIIDQVNLGKLSPDVSFGRQPDGSNSWYLFQEATPGLSNSTQGFTGITEDPHVSYQGGFYSTPVTVSISSVSVNDTVHVTFDGSEPTNLSEIYTTPIQISSTTVLRAKSFNLNLLPSKSITNTYFIDFTTQLPVVSLSTDPANLFDEEIGIYTLGDSAESSFPYFGANFWKDWEKPIHVEFFEKYGLKSFDLDAGVQIFGGYSRAYRQKSLAIYSRGQYGISDINYKLFDDLPYSSYQAFVLRNSGDDWTSTMFRDGMMTGLVDGIDIDKQAFKPVVLFINGIYWGIHNIREKADEHYLAQHHNINPDSIDILENFAEINEGNNQDYMELYSFIENNSLANSQNYEFVRTKIDVDNFIQYCIAQIYFDNTDWPGNNTKYWKGKNGGKWRWILFDTDFGFGLLDPNNYVNNTLEFAVVPNGPSWPNPPWSTLFLRKLLENESFKNDFINCYADYMNSIFDSSVVVNKINSIEDLIESEIQRHGERWNTFNFDEWLINVQVLRDFAVNRNSYLRDHFIQKFELPGLSNVNLSTSDTSMGTVKINSLTIKSPNWTGSYFLGVPISITAQPKSGFRFVRWASADSTYEDSLSITLTGAINLTAIFGVDSSFNAPKIVINEINYNSSVSFNTEDWIELYNNDENSVDISGWLFKDSDDAHNFYIPQGTILEKDEYLVMCIDTSLFKPLFPTVQQYVGNVGFGLSGGGELIRLYDKEMKLIDSLIYDDDLPWPIPPDGNGPTLSLKNPNFDNSLPENWAASLGNGTPGKINDTFIEIPVELTSFTAEVHNKNIVIQWTTASEINNRGFYVERNITGKWESIHFSEGRGTTTATSSYEFIDILPTKIINNSISYRLRQVDFNGNSTYSGIFEVNLSAVPTNFQLNQNYPNPFNNSTIIMYAVSRQQFVTLIVYDVLGREVKKLVNEEKSIGIYEIEFNASSIPSGIYFYRLTAGSFVNTKKMVMIR